MRLRRNQHGARGVKRIRLFVVLRKLKLANWKSWSQREREALDDVLSAKFDDLTLADEPDGGDIDQMICGLALAGEPLASYFANLVERPDALRSFFGENAGTFYTKRKLSNDSWCDDREAMTQIMEWLGRVDDIGVLCIPASTVEHLQQFHRRMLNERRTSHGKHLLMFNQIIHRMDRLLLKCNVHEAGAPFQYETMRALYEAGHP